MDRDVFRLWNQPATVEPQPSTFDDASQRVPGAEYLEMPKIAQSWAEFEKIIRATGGSAECAVTLVLHHIPGSSVA